MPVASNTNPNNNPGRVFFGIMCIFFGGVYLARELGHTFTIPLKFEILWPIILIFIGLSFFMKGKKGSSWIGLVLGLLVMLILLRMIGIGLV